MKSHSIDIWLPHTMCAHTHEQLHTHEELLLPGKVIEGFTIGVHLYHILTNKYKNLRVVSGRKLTGRRKDICKSFLFNAYFFLDLFILCMSVLASFMYVYHVRTWCPWKSGEGIRASRTAVRVIVSQYVGVGN